jgi:uncharacterized protein (DUF1330 family)
MPKGYIIAELTVTSPGPEFEEYRQKVLGTIEAFGGRFLVRSGDPKLLEGKKPVGRAVIIEFDSPDRAISWYNSAEYKKILPLRLRNAISRTLCAAGTEDS